jgi:hypothetical protein
LATDVRRCASSQEVTNISTSVTTLGQQVTDLETDIKHCSSKQQVADLAGVIKNCTSSEQVAGLAANIKACASNQLVVELKSAIAACATFDDLVAVKETVDECASAALVDSIHQELQELSLGPSQEDIAAPLSRQTNKILDTIEPKLDRIPRRAFQRDDSEDVMLLNPRNDDSETEHAHPSRNRHGGAANPGSSSRTGIASKRPGTSQPPPSFTAKSVKVTEHGARPRVQKSTAAPAQVTITYASGTAASASRALILMVKESR